MHYYNFNIADWSLHTNHLSLEEEAVYRRLLDFYYDTEQSIPKETQPVIRRLRLVNHSDIVALILEEFFKLEDDGWHNLRADSEIIDYHAKAETARANGKKGGRPKKNNPDKTKPVILANPDKTQTKANQELITINQELLTKDECFDVFYKSYPKKKGKEAAKKAWNKIKHEDAPLIIKALANACKTDEWIKDKGKFVPHPATWLNGKRWEDEEDTTQQQSEEQPVNDLMAQMLKDEEACDAST